MEMDISAIEVVKEFYRWMNINDLHSAGQMLRDSYTLESFTATSCVVFLQLCNIPFTGK
jgi:hypothetical protein